MRWRQDDDELQVAFRYGCRAGTDFCDDLIMKFGMTIPNVIRCCGRSFAKSPTADMAGSRQQGCDSAHGWTSFTLSLSMGKMLFRWLERLMCKQRKLSTFTSTI